MSNFDAEQFGKLAIFLVLGFVFFFFLGFGTIFIENLGKSAFEYYFLKLARNKWVRGRHAEYVGVGSS